MISKTIFQSKGPFQASNITLPKNTVLQLETTMPQLIALTHTKCSTSADLDLVAGGAIVPATLQASLHKLPRQEKAQITVRDSKIW